MSTGASSFVPGQPQHQLPRVDGCIGRDQGNNRHHPVQGGCRTCQHCGGNEDEPNAAQERERSGTNEMNCDVLPSRGVPQLSDDRLPVYDRLQDIKNAEPDQRPAEAQRPPLGDEKHQGDDHDQD